MNTEKHLDEQVRQALEKLQARFDDRAWKAFEQRLERDAPSGKTAFDDAISGKLNRLEVPLAAGEWSKMEKMIEAEETAEQLENEAVVDNVVYEKLERFEVPFQPHHWQMMAHRLEDEFFVRYHLIRCKVAELGLMLLLLLTFVRFTPIFEGKIQDNNSTNWPVPPASVKMPIIQSASTRTPLVAEAGSKPKNLLTANVLSKDSPTKYSAPTKPKAASSVPPIPIAGTALIADLGLQPHSAALSTLPSLGLSDLKAMGAFNSLFETITGSRLQNNTLRTPGIGDDRLNNSNLLASLGTQPIHSKYAWEVPQLPQRIFEKERQLRFGIFTSTDIAYVLTPPNKYSVFDTLISTGHDTTLASGYGGGITVSWKKGKWEFQTGGIYSFKRYIPNTPVIFFETVNYIIREEFNGVQLDILQVPLNASYHLKNEGKWRVYTQFGASGHFITSSVYEIASSRVPSPRNLIVMPPITDGLPDDDESITEEKDFPQGLFDGGTFFNNFYLTANLGFGMERFVTPRWSLFFQPNYQHHILTDGIGVNGEKLYNFSFNIGTKVSLK